jgi:hypothetical protein
MFCKVILGDGGEGFSLERSLVAGDNHVRERQCPAMSWG